MLLAPFLQDPQQKIQQSPHTVWLPHQPLSATMYFRVTRQAQTGYTLVFAPRGRASNSTGHLPSSFPLRALCDAAVAETLVQYRALSSLNKPILRQR